MGEERWVVPGIRFRIILGLSLHISIAVKETGFTVSVRAIHWIQVVQLPLRLYRLYINRGVVRVVVVLVKNGKKKQTWSVANTTPLWLGQLTIPFTVLRRNPQVPEGLITYKNSIMKLMDSIHEFSSQAWAKGGKTASLRIKNDHTRIQLRSRWSY